MSTHRVRLDPERVKLMAEEAPDATEPTLGIYRMIFNGEWERIEKLDHFPTVNEATCLAMAELCVAWDRKQAEFRTSRPR